MRILALILATAVTLISSVSAQSMDRLLEQATAPVEIEFTIGAQVHGQSMQTLASAGLLQAMPARMDCVQIKNQQVLNDRREAERNLSRLGVDEIEALLRAEAQLRVGLFIEADSPSDGIRLEGSIHGLNIQSVLKLMGEDALSELDDIAAGDSAVAARAGVLVDELSTIRVDIETDGTVIVEGASTNAANLERTLSHHNLARTAQVHAPGDLALNRIVPVLNALRDAGLETDVKATSSAIVTIEQRDN